MIYTRFGGQVSVVSGSMDTGEVTVRRDDGSELETYIFELRADGGLAEIAAVITTQQLKAA